MTVKACVISLLGDFSLIHFALVYFLKTWPDLQAGWLRFYSHSHLFIHYRKSHIPSHFPYMNLCVLDDQHFNTVFYMQTCTVCISLFYVRQNLIQSRSCIWTVSALVCLLSALLLPALLISLSFPRRSPIWEVTEWALRAVPSKRLCRLAQPRVPAAGWQPDRPLLAPVSNTRTIFWENYSVCDGSQCVVVCHDVFAGYICFVHVLLVINTSRKFLI